MVTPLADGVWWYDLSAVNAYLIDDRGTLTLVDAGLPWQDTALVAGLDAAGYAMDDLDRVLLTHFDADHVGGLAAFDPVDVDIYVGRPDAPLVTGERSPPLGNHKGLLQRVFGTFLEHPDNPVEPVVDGDTVGSFTVHHTPGHTPGHVSYVSEAHSLAVLGDLVREANGAFEPSPWLISYDTGQVRRSIRELAAELPALDVAAPGHGVPFDRAGSDRFATLADSL